MTSVLVAVSAAAAQLVGLVLVAAGLTVVLGSGGALIGAGIIAVGVGIQADAIARRPPG